MIISKRVVTIGLVAGELSGDMLGAGLIRTLRNYLPKSRFVGVAGPNMQAEGMEAWYGIEEVTAMGIVEVIKHIPRLLYIRYNLFHRFATLNPDIFIGIDSPDFTIFLENRLKQLGIKTIHYVSPSVWAWRKKRIFKIGRSVDNVLTVLPFEKAIYDRHNIPCQFIGHALADIIPLDPDKSAARRKLGIATNARCLALLPGSRQSEIALLSANFLRAAELVRHCFPELNIIVPLANSIRRKQFERIKAEVAPSFSVKILENQAHLAMIASDVTVLASGTASLECMLAKCPMVVGYRVHPITFAIAKKLVKTSWISLPNLLAGHSLVTELLQESCQPELLAKAILELFDNTEKRKTLLSTFRYLHQQIRRNANERAARIVLEMIYS